jgi:hypothetical protein
MSFPTSPSDGQVYTNALGTQYKYNATHATWNIQSLLATGIQGQTGIIGATGIQGVTGSQGFTGLANFIDSTGFPTTSPPELLYNRTDDALYYGSTGTNWIQVSTSMSQGPTGPQGITGLQGVTGIQGTTGAPMGVTGVFNFDIRGLTGIIGDITLPARTAFTNWQVTLNLTGIIDIDLYRSTYTNYRPGATGLTATGVGIYGSVAGIKGSGTTSYWYSSTGAQGDIITINVAGLTGGTATTPNLRATLALNYYNY